MTELAIKNAKGATDSSPCGPSGVCLIEDVEAWARTVERWRSWAISEAGALNGQEPAAALLAWADGTRHWLDLRDVGLFGLGLFGSALPGSPLDIDQASQAVEGMISDLQNVRPILAEAQAKTGTPTPGAIETQGRPSDTEQILKLAKFGLVAWAGFKIWESVKG